ncbi:hypothetical protein K505DRAFT_322050 [Melanomma pulvis-pyrius CBS 109.77]|uniref:BHLH domain-containing protein n=1 Tax=Melanomma pulvis-pyrius CBS 109.77 TaxID=1314802 RepID=A0A6A6XPR8_9PLEO|nr:hypothetical protein K505DRAFT_322050 [Melanomma pulvis-pyrius CBS 109.77]
MDATDPDRAPDYGLELDSIAVGPYCVFDAFKPPLSPRTNPQTSPRAPVKMEAPIMSSEFPFAGGMRPSWFTTAGDDVTLAAPVDELARSDWNEWMQWDPASSQNPELKPLHVQGPACFLKSDQRPPPLFNRRQSAQLREPSLGLSTDIPTSAPMTGRTAFTFGESDELPPAFAFAGNTLSSPSSADTQQQNGFYSPPMWQQQQQQQQQQQAGENSMFSAQRFESSVSSAAQAPPISTPSLHHSPSSLHNGRASSSSVQSSPEPAPSNPKKRKSSTEELDEASEGRKDKQQPVKKTAHNMIEKRYRNNLNDKIAALRDSVPSLRVMSRGNGTGEEEDDPEDLEGLTPAHKLNKATVLSKATEYIRHLEKRNKRLQDEVTTLTSRLDSYEKLAISGSMALHNSVGTPDGSRYQEDPFAHQAGMSMSGPPQGMIPVPENISNLHRGIPPQQHYAPAYPAYTSAGGRPGLSGPPLINGRRSSGAMGKLMVGSLAGLMILEGLAEHEKTSDAPARRGLLALPLNLASFLTPQVSFGAGSAPLPLAKLLLLFGAVFYIVAPWIDFRTKPKKKSTSTIILAPAPSLASPVEVRHKAWLTAIQTVWVPQHTFLLEVAALGLKTLKLSTRKLIGWDGYALLTGITREQEAARVKAWNIALDAQLTGGDAEISKSRLVLTLMASGTLPDTPALLMLKALHIRVLLWELANAGYGSWWKFDALSASLARRYWNAARTEQKIAANMALKPNSGIEALPAHLVALLERECDDVLVPTIIQRAYNLAWNRPSAENTTLDESMDGVVEDFAICSPLDALAAWYSSYVLRRGLANYLGSKSGALRESVICDLKLATNTSPPTSQARVRALVAQAVVLDTDRSEHIATAFDALPSLPSTSSRSNTSNSRRAKLINLVGDAPVAADVWKALTLAKCHALTESSNIEARRRAANVVNQTFLPEATMTLLSFVAGYKVLGHFIHDPSLKAQSSQGLERLASSLRMWVGHETGRRSGLSNNARGRIIGRCLDASKTLVGLAEPEEIDDGYVSSSVKGD